MRGKSAAPKVVRLSARARAGGEMGIGTVSRWGPDGVWVDLAGEAAPCEARVMLPPGAATDRCALEVGERVVVWRDPNGTPVILGRLQPLGEVPAQAESEARVDGRRIELTAAEEIVLKCGEASLVLRKNGRVLLKGVQVETRAKGAHRIKGGTVAIN